MAIAPKENKGFMEKLLERISEVYKEEAQKIVDEHKEKIAKELDSLMDQLVMRAGLSVRENIRMQDDGRELIFTIEKINK